jgi:hypothetical protein
LDSDGKKITIGESNDIPNNMNQLLKDDWDSKDEGTGIYGFFLLKNIENTETGDGSLGKFFVNIEFFAKNLT